LTDLDYLEAVLRERPGEWITHAAILTRSFNERGCGLTIHSRASQLRTERGLNIDCKTERAWDPETQTYSGRVQSAYRLLSAPNDRPAGETTPPSPTPQAARSTGRRYETDGAAGATPADNDESAAETQASSSMAVSAAEKTGSAQDPPTRGEGETQAAAGTSGASTPQTSLFDMPVRPAHA
jgi:hypothetical protein